MLGWLVLQHYHGKSWRIHLYFRESSSPKGIFLSTRSMGPQTRKTPRIQRMGQGIQVPGRCSSWIDSGFRSWRRQKPVGILLILLYHTEGNLLPTAKFSANEGKTLSRNSEMLAISFLSNRAPEKWYCSTLLSGSLLTWDLQDGTAPGAGRKFLQGIVSSATQKAIVWQWDVAGD